MSTLDVPTGIRFAPRLRVSVPLLVKALFAVDLLLGALYLATIEISRYRPLHFTGRLFDLDREANLPVWFSSMQLFGAAVLTGVFAWCFARRADRSSWVLVLPPALLLFLSLDEVATIHEWIGHKFEQAFPALGRKNRSFSRTGLWMFVLGPPLLLGAWAVGRRAWTYLRGRRDVIALYGAGFVMLVLAAGGGDFWSNYVPPASRLLALTIIVEEVGEMLAGTLLLWASWRLLGSHGIRLIAPSALPSGTALATSSPPSSDRSSEPMLAPSSADIPKNGPSQDLKPLYWRSWREGIRNRRLFREVQTYCMFIGYPRSGHSLVGSLLDAHRNMVIAHELDALRYLAAGFGRRQIYALIMANEQEFTRTGRTWTGYHYQVPNQWQGRHDRLQVIGDKRGGSSTLWLQKRPELLERMKKTVGVPLKLVHVVRNPFDNIATILTRQQQPSLDESIRWYFDMCRTVDRVMDDEAGSVITVRHEDLIADAMGSLGKLCGFLGVQADEDYLSDCASIVFSSPKQTRSAVTWSDMQIRAVEEQIRRYEFLDGYRY